MCAGHSDANRKRFVSATLNSDLCVVLSVHCSLWDTGSLDPSKVGSGVQIGETSSSSGITVDDTDSGDSGSGAKCSC